jgi:hypothetical protein
MWFNSLDLKTLRVPRRREQWPEGSTEIRTLFGQDVLWHPVEHGGHHLSVEKLEPYRQLGDGPVDRVLQLLEEEGTPLGPGDDFVLLAQEAFRQEQNKTLLEFSTAQRELASFWKQYQKMPPWVDVEQLQRGQEVYLKYAPAIAMSLYYRSLVSGFSIPKIAAVIMSTGYLAPPARPEQSLQRLMDTGSLIFACVAQGVNALLPGGDGWRTCLHVRALHAKIRWGLLKRKGTKQAWDTPHYGIPINQEDMAATLCAFSINSLCGIEFASGVPVPRQEMLDYLAMWRYIGWLLGVEIDGDNNSSAISPLDPCGPGRGPIADPIRHSISTLSSIIFHIMKPDQTSTKIAFHLLSVKPARTKPESKSRNSSDNHNFYLRALLCRRFVGDPLASALGLPLHPRLLTRVSLAVRSTSFLLILRLYTLASIYMPSFVRSRLVRFHLWGMQRMHSRWKKTHMSKMAKALRTGNIQDIVAVSTVENNEDSNYGTSSCCPFAMIRSPSIGVSHQN